MVCTRLLHEGGEPGRFNTRAWTVDATTNAILELADHLAVLNVLLICLENPAYVGMPTQVPSVAIPSARRTAAPSASSSALACTVIT